MSFRPGGFKPRKNSLNVVGHSDSSLIKQEIQDTLRQIVILRDGGCIFRHMRGHFCTSSYTKDGHIVLQADHLISRGNGATYADPRLVVCVCEGIHSWKSIGGNARKKQYDEMVRAILPPDRVALWDACERDSWRPTPMRTNDWKLALVALQAQLRAMMTS